jgi:hypothetical protein
MTPMERRDGSLQDSYLVRDPLTGKECPAEVREHVGAGLVTWVEVAPDRWVIMVATG